MNYLQLCQSVARESGTVAGVAPFTTVQGATGRVDQIAHWVRDAYIDIQNERTDWRWMRKRFASPLVAGEPGYQPAFMGVVGYWVPDIPHQHWRTLSIYEDGFKSQENDLDMISLEAWSSMYLRGVHDQGRPRHWTISPQNDILFGPTPDKAYIVAGEFRAAPQELKNDDDEPEMPARFHRLIVADALRLMAQSDEAWQVLNAKAMLYDRLRGPLVKDQTPPLYLGHGYR